MTGKPTSRISALALALAVGVASLAGAEERLPRSVGVASSPTRGVALPADLFAVGARDAGSAATVVLCTNLGPLDSHVYVEIVEFNGTIDCVLDFTASQLETWTVASRNTALYVEDGVCSTPPGTAQGLVIVKATIEDDLYCTVQVIDPASATPAYLTTLTLYDGEGNLESTWIFKDGFERGDPYRWSSEAGVLP